MLTTRTLFLSLVFPGKYGHAAIFHLVKHNTDQGAVDCMLCNLPASTKGKPSLLRHQNVVTFFHEFGVSHGITDIITSAWLCLFDLCHP